MGASEGVCTRTVLAGAVTAESIRPLADIDTREQHSGLRCAYGTCGDK